MTKQTVNNSNKQEEQKNGQEWAPKDTQELLTLMSIYLDEWKHRDSILWKQTFTFFWATLIVMLLPFAAKYLQINIPDKLPQFLFPLIGIIMSFLFIIISQAYAIRLTAVGKGYYNLIDKLPEEFRRNTVEVEYLQGKIKPKEKEKSKPKKPGETEPKKRHKVYAKILNSYLAKGISWIMFVLLFITGLILLHLTLAG